MRVSLANKRNRLWKAARIRRLLVLCHELLSIKWVKLLCFKSSQNGTFFKNSVLSRKSFRLYQIYKLVQRSTIGQNTQLMIIKIFRENFYKKVVSCTRSSYLSARAKRQKHVTKVCSLEILHRNITVVY